jgi:ribosomal protein S18 acetylase RimI-like enzyme
MDFQIIECDFNNPLHRQKIIELTASYMRDPMGGEEIMNETVAKNLAEGLANHPACFVVFAVLDRKFVGIATSFINFSTFKARPYFNIHDIAVLKEFRGQGIGKKLLAYIIKKALERGYCKVTLEVRDDNLNAKELYQSLGFKDTEPKMHFWTKII